MSNSSLSEPGSDLEDIKEDLINSIQYEGISAPVSPVHEQIGADQFKPISRSAPPSPVSRRVSLPLSSRVRNLISDIESRGSVKSKVLQVAQTVMMTEIQDHKEEIANLKRVCTRFLNQLKNAERETTLDGSLLSVIKPKIISRITQLEDKEMELDATLNKLKKAEGSPERLYCLSLVEYITNTETELARISKLVVNPVVPGEALGGAVDPVELLTRVSQIGNNPIKINVECPVFNGDEKDCLEFKNWLVHFEAVVKTEKHWTEETKITYLKSKVLKNAAQFIAHLDARAGNYDACLKALKEQYEDESFIVDEYFKLLYNESPDYDETYTKTRVYIAGVRNHLHNLKTHYNIDLLDEASSGHKFLSHIIFGKFSGELRKAFSRECKSDYPTFAKILEHYGKVINSLARNRRKRPVAVTKLTPKPSNYSKPWQNKNPNTHATTLNFAVPEVKKKHEELVLHCRFCNVNGHSNLHCPNFLTCDDRIKKCKELKICIYCTSLKHDSENCQGLQDKLWKACKFCNSRQHIGALCPKRTISKPINTNACLSTSVGQQSNYLLPVLSITMQGREGKQVTFNALFDTASSRSYINPKVANMLAIKGNLVTNMQHEVRTFLGMGTKSLGETTLQVYFPSGKYHALPIFIDDSFYIDLEVRGLSRVVTNLRALNYPLGAEFNESSDKLEINGLIGSDIIQYINFFTVKCMSGIALNIENKIIPFGNSEHFLYPGQVGNFSNCHSIENNYKTILSEVKCPDTFVNTCLDPKATYEDSFGPIFDESSVERRLDRMVSCDSLGIGDIADQGVSDYDKIRIDQFEAGIEIKDQVYVELVWEDNVSEVPSNHAVALSVLDRVSKKLEKNGLLEVYNNVFFEQLSENIIEEFECDPKDFNKYIWLPHRPVVKDEAQSTFKVRPVFNASLKTSPDKPSLNEASYQGINNMQDMLMLIMLFRTNKFVLLGDLRKAFLQIRLKLLRDRNRFCFFLKHGNRLRCFRYNTLLFGYCCSPFILNFVIKHIAKLHPADDCSRMMQSSFFVDNLVKTGNSVEELTQLYLESVKRLEDVHFDLRSCNSNSSELQAQMKKDDRYVKHGQELDKVLGYHYSPDSDQLQVHSVSMDSEANSKRKILSESSKLFDPLSLTGPVTVRSKQLISKLWKRKRSQKNHWDETVDKECCKEWANLSKDLEGLSSVKFPRMSLLDDLPMDVFIFCDASKYSYGFVAYAVQQGESNFLFAKPKVAPLSGRSLPQLELLGAVLGSQGLLTILETFKHVKINYVYIHLDAQIVLSWVLSPSRTKNVYTSNCIKSVKKNVIDASEKYGVEILFKYVPTGDNPADMLSRGITLEKFIAQLDFWIHGPEWIRGETVHWPSSDFGCLSEASKNLVMCTLGVERSPLSPVVAFERFSCFTRLLASTSRVFSFLKSIGVLKEETMRRLWGTTEALEISKLHLIKIMQADAFPHELDYLSGPRVGSIPARVRDMNLFLDKFGIIRSDGRMGKVHKFDYNLIYPILLAPRQHALTQLIVKFYHHEVQHLGIQSTLNKVKRAGFRFIHPYQTVKAIIKPCMTCKKINSLSFNYPKMTDLPRDRVNLVRPYLHIGVDYTGFIMVKEGEKEVKYYLLILTCLSTRAIHLELIPNQSTEQFVLALVRFCNVYGIPEAIYSDNALSFISGALVMKEVFTSDEFKSAFGTHSIKHITIPLGAPWVGSVWERCIRTVKTCLRKAIGRQKLDYFRLKTVLSDIQSAVNQRPLTYRCSEDFGLEVISPSNFLNPYVENSLLIKNPKGLLSNTKARKLLIESLETRDNLLETFKQIWYDEYLLGLRDSFRDLHDAKFVNQVRVGDIVLLKNTQPSVVKKRQHWSLARVLELVYGADGKVRSVKLLKGTADYQTKPRQPELHPINHLFPLELNITHQHRVATPTNQEYDNLVHMPVDSAFDFTSSTNDCDTDREDCDDPIDQAELSVPNDYDTGREDCNDPIVPAGSTVPTLKDSNISLEPVVQGISNVVPLGGDAEINQPIVEPLRYSNRGRRIIPRKGYEDFVT